MNRCGVREHWPGPGWDLLSGIVFAFFNVCDFFLIIIDGFFHRNTISAWSSGTGGAHFFGSLAYAGLTEPHLADLTPKTALRLMLIIPILFAITWEVQDVLSYKPDFSFWLLVVMPKTVYRVQILKPGTYYERTAEKTTVQIRDNGNIDMKASKKLVLKEKFQLMRVRW